jgi:hypothetical protein
MTRAALKWFKFFSFLGAKKPLQLAVELELNSVLKRIFLRIIKAFVRGQS